MKANVWPVRILLPLAILAVMAVTGAALAPQDLTTSTLYQSPTSAGGGVMFSLQTNAFALGSEIPRKYTCAGEDRSPDLSWSEPPPHTESLALIADDPDAPSGTFTHWIAYDLPPQTRELAEGAGNGALPGGARQGRNGFGKTGYGGPCPPPGKPHRYFFKLYALDGKLDLAAGASREQLEQAMKGHVLAKSELMGTFKR